MHGVSHLIEMDDGGDVLTKAKLYATMSDDDSWTEMGVGVVSVALRPSVPLDGDDGDGGGGKAERTVGHLEMIDINNPEELLMSTPITLSDAYVVQHETILWWSDPQLGRLMACSFNTKEGCEKIYKDIMAYQRSRKTAVSREMNGAEAVSASSMCSHWVVCRENLPAILSAATTNAQRFGVYVRGRDTYFKELAELFQACQRDGDVRGMDLTGQVTLSLLRSPFSTDGKIIAQFVENTLVDMCVDIVQYAIGRRDRSTGFVSFEERRATFRNPLELPESIVSRIHVLYSCGYLKDLLPLSLDEADAVPSSLLSTYLVSTKFRLVEDICRSSVILPQAFKRAQSNVGSAFDVVAFVHDMCKTIKNSMLPLESKTAMFEVLVEAGLLPFLQFVLDNALRGYANAEPLVLPQQSQKSCVPPGMAMQMACDILCSCIMLYPPGRSNLIGEATSSPDRCLLELLLQCIVTSQCDTELQAAVDAVLSCGIGILQYLPGSMEMGGTTKHDVVRFWVEGVAGRRPSFLLLVFHIVNTLASGKPIVRDSHEEARVLHALKVLTALMGDVDEPLSRPCADSLVQAGLMPSLDAALRISARSSANVQSSVVAFAAAVLESGRRHVVERLLGNGDFFDAAIHRYMECGRRNNVLSASLAHLFDCLCRSIHREKSAQVRLRTCTTSSPFVRLLNTSDEAEMSAGSDDATVEDDMHHLHPQRRDNGCGGVCQSLGTRLWAAHGEELRARLPAFAAKLEHALHETPEEAQSADAETSSVASTMERGVKGITDLEFDAMVADFGVEMQPRRQFLSPLCSAGSFAQGSANQTNEPTDQASNNNDKDEEKREREEEGEEGDETEEPLRKRSRSESSTFSSAV